MGVPSYFAWLVRHSPEIISKKPAHVPDRLYLDLNCAIHPAVKARPMTQEEMYPAIWQYILDIVNQVKPKKLLYVAIDGVAPQAKMKQQRARRYKTILDRQLKQRLQRQYKIQEQLTVEHQHDFNMISPGTQFMVDLAVYLKDRLRILKATLNIQIIFSGADVSGEGEHKIMNHISNLGDTGGNIVVYGLDSDLIFLTLRHYRPGIALFRERQFFERTDETADGDDSSEVPDKEFSYLSIDILREALVQVMSPLKNITEIKTRNVYPKSVLQEYHNNLKTKTFDINSGRLTLDYVYICFLLGNDFLPGLVALKIKDNGLDQVILAYKLTQAELADYLIDVTNEATGSGENEATPAGENEATGSGENEATLAGENVNFHFLKIFIRYLASIEEQLLQQHTKSRHGRIANLRQKTQAQQLTYETELQQSDYLELLTNDSSLKLNLGYDNSWQQKYYQIAFHCKSTVVDLTRVYQQYLYGLQWTWYYYKNALSVEQDWVYPFEHGPLLVDFSKYLDSLASLPTSTQLTGFRRKTTPLEQLMQILPPQSAALLPDPLANLVTDAKSGLVHIYPNQVALDTSFKQYRWQAHPVLPPIDRPLLHRLVGLHLSDLLEEEQIRNKLGDSIEF